MVVENMVEECPIRFFVQPWNMFWIIRLIHAHFVSIQPISLDGPSIMGANLSMKPWFKEDLLSIPNVNGLLGLYLLGP
tara:strand:- start:239 stop:472 length:234 start_codon:yes stop_codon:yes gene_type:complete